jgi:hypothetical protein
MSTNSDHTLPGAHPIRLCATAAGLRLAFSSDVVEAVGVPGAIVAVPGAQPWLVGLTVWRGRLHSLVDAGLLFGDRPAAAAGLIVFKGLGIDTTLAVDAVPRPIPDGEPVDLDFDLASLSAHFAFQPGAGMREAS